MDRVAATWGPRTPHAEGTVRPARVDLRLEPGLGEQDVDRWVQSACGLCSNGCGCDITGLTTAPLVIQQGLTPTRVVAAFLPQGLCTVVAVALTLPAGVRDSGVRTAPSW